MTFGTIDQTNSTYWVSRRVKRATSMKMKNPAGLFHIWTQRDHHTAGLSFPAARYQTHLLHYRHTPHLYFCVHNLKGKWTQYNNVSMLITRSLIFFCARVLQVHTRCILARCDLMQKVLFCWCVINVDIVGVRLVLLCSTQCVPTGIINVDNMCQNCTIVYQLVLSRWTWRYQQARVSIQMLMLLLLFLPSASDWMNINIMVITITITIPTTLIVNNLKARMQLFNKLLRVAL